MPLPSPTVLRRITTLVFPALLCAPAAPLLTPSAAVAAPSVETEFSSYANATLVRASAAGGLRFVSPTSTVETNPTFSAIHSVTPSEEMLASSSGVWYKTTPTSLAGFSARTLVANPAWLKTSYTFGSARTILTTMLGANSPIVKVAPNRFVSNSTTIIVTSGVISELRTTNGEVFEVQYTNVSTPKISGTTVLSTVA